MKRHGQLAQRVSDLFVRNKAQGGHLENVFFFIQLDCSLKCSMLGSHT